MNHGESAGQSIRLPLCGKGATSEELYSLMFAIRVFEESLLELYSSGSLSGTTHTYLGQEATAVGLASELDLSKDLFFSNHRGHGHFLAYCGEVERLYLEIMGKPGGICAGRGGSQHLHYRNFYSNGILASNLPVAAGAAKAEKEKKSEAVVAVFMGDGALGEGIVYETFNIASLWRLPMLFVIEANGWAQSTRTNLQVAGQIKHRPESFGIQTLELTTTDVHKIVSTSAEMISNIRSKSRPQCIVIHNHRLGPHSKGDDDRTPQELAEIWKNEPLEVSRQHLDQARAEKIHVELRALVDQAKDLALAAPTY